MYSDRFQNSDAIICPVWNQMDSAGRPVCADSFYTKYQGCSSATDRIDVENHLRPQYMEYVTLDAAGIDGGAHCSCDVGVGDVMHSHTMTHSHAMGAAEGFKRPAQNQRGVQPFQKNAVRENYVHGDAVRGCQVLQDTHMMTGQFGQGNFRSYIDPSCSMNGYEDAAAQCAADNRYMQAAYHGAENYRKNKCSR